MVDEQTSQPRERIRRRRQLLTAAAPIDLRYEQGTRADSADDTDEQGTRANSADDTDEQGARGDSADDTDVAQSGELARRRRRQLLTTAAPISGRPVQGARTDSGDNAGEAEGGEEGVRANFEDNAGVAEGGEAGKQAHRRQRRRPTRFTQTVPDYLDRRELLALVPLSMSSIDALEKKGEFPSRFVLSPTVKVCWRRHEVEKWLAERARRRVHQAAKD